MIAEVVGFGTVLSPRANWRITDFAGTPVQGPGAKVRRVRDRVAGLGHPLGFVDRLLDRTRARHRVDERGQVPERDVLVERNGPGRFTSDGVRPARLSQVRGRKPPSRATSMIEPPGTFGTPVWTFGSTARNFVP